MLKPKGMREYQSRSYSSPLCHEREQFLNVSVNFTFVKCSYTSFSQDCLNLNHCEFNTLTFTIVIKYPINILVTFSRESIPLNKFPGVLVIYHHPFTDHEALVLEQIKGIKWIALSLASDCALNNVTGNNIQLHKGRFRVLIFLFVLRLWFVVVLFSSNFSGT